MSHYNIEIGIIIIYFDTDKHIALLLKGEE